MSGQELMKPEVQAVGMVETQGSAIGAQMRAQILGRMELAVKFPRSMQAVRAEIIADCERPGFAEKARYRRPVGGGKSVDGWTIRFAEGAARALGNIDISARVVSEDAVSRVVSVQVVDIQKNIPYSLDIVIKKTVERKDLQGRQALGQRVNSKGEITYLVEATEEELQVKQGALISKAIRTNVLRLVPADILEEALEKVIDTNQKAIKGEFNKDPKVAIAKVVDWYRKNNISPDDLAAYLGHPVDAMKPDEIADLRSLQNAMVDDKLTWSEIMAAKTAKVAAEESSVDDQTALINALAQLKAVGEKPGATKKDLLTVVRALPKSLQGNTEVDALAKEISEKLK